MSIKNLIYKKVLTDFDLNELARYMGYVDYDEFAEEKRDLWLNDIHNCEADSEYPPFDKLLQEDAKEKLVQQGLMNDN